jgi:hypothetical protein
MAEKRAAQAEQAAGQNAIAQHAAVCLRAAKLWRVLQGCRNIQLLPSAFSDVLIPGPLARKSTFAETWSDVASWNWTLETIWVLPDFFDGSSGFLNYYGGCLCT